MIKNTDSATYHEPDPAPDNGGGTADLEASGGNAATPPLRPDQRQRLRALAESLDRDQALWASGYLAGLAESRLLSNAAPLAEAAPSESPATITVLYGSETGNARKLAERAGRALTEKGLATQVIDMEEYKSNRLKQEKYLIIVTATHGEGDPPEPARPFYEFLMGRKAPKLKGMRFAVLGLGDSSYEHFCQAAKDFDARLEKLGGERMCGRVEYDIDYETLAAAWIEEITISLEDLTKHGSAGQTAFTTGSNQVAVSPQVPEFHSGNPFLAPMLDRIVLNARGSDKTTYHVELSLDGSGLNYVPGDSLGVVVQNDPALVEEIITTLGLASEPGLMEELQHDFELTLLTPRFISAYGEAAEIRPLRELVADKEALWHYLDGRQIVDVVREYPPANGLSTSGFKSLLRKLEPRLYSLASSQTACPDEAHITVAEVRFQSPLSTRHGVASSYLGRRLNLDDSIPVYIERNDRFRLPVDPSTPIVMIGAGTGVAPYRAFLQERAEQGASGKSWLFFGERRFRTDFLYQAEWQQLMKEGTLSRMDVAFSRDQAEKIYVQDRIRQQGRDLFTWLEEGAHLYVCGDAKHMAPDVHAALIDIVAEHGARDKDAAREYINDLTIERRYKRDVY